MSTWSDPGGWWLVLAGWSAIVALWHTSVIALAFAAWRVWRRTASPPAEYVAASAALALAAVLTLATPLALQWQPARSAAPLPGPRPTPRLRGLPSEAAAIARPADSSTTAESMALRAVPWTGALWCAGIVIGLLRFAGGWAWRSGFGVAPRGSRRPVSSTPSLTSVRAGGCHRPRS